MSGLAASSSASVCAPATDGALKSGSMIGSVAPTFVDVSSRVANKDSGNVDAHVASVPRILQNSPKLRQKSEGRRKSGSWTDWIQVLPSQMGAMFIPNSQGRSGVS